MPLTVTIQIALLFVFGFALGRLSLAYRKPVVPPVTIDELNSSIIEVAHIHDIAFGPLSEKG